MQLDALKQTNPLCQLWLNSSTTGFYAPSVCGWPVSSPNGLFTITIITKLPDVQHCCAVLSVVLRLISGSSEACGKTNRQKGTSASTMHYTTIQTSPSVFKVSTAVLSRGEVMCTTESLSNRVLIAAIKVISGLVGKL